MKNQALHTHINTFRKKKKIIYICITLRFNLIFNQYNFVCKNKPTKNKKTMSDYIKRIKT